MARPSRSRSLARSIRLVAGANAAWMAFVWVQRIRNAVANDEPDPTGAYVMSATMLAGAAALAVVAGTAPESPAARALVRLVPAAHGALWVVRGVQIATAGHSVPFVVVHEVLAVISLALAAWAWRTAGSVPSTAGEAGGGSVPGVGATRGPAATI